MAEKKHRPPIESLPAETRMAEVTTVCWMLSVMTTLVCSVAAGVAWLLVRSREVEGNELLFSRYMHFCAVVSAVTSLVLLAIVFKVRHDPPPRSITAFAAVTALLPIVAAFF